MKRQTKIIKKRTYSLKGAIPSFITLCGAGANLTPLSQLRYSENEKFGQDIEINRIEFAKTKFGSHEEVANYLNENAYEEFSITESGDTWVVLGAEADKFEDVKPVEYEDGVLYFIGKLKVPTDEETPAAEIISAEEFAAKKKDDESKEDPSEEKTETPDEEAGEEGNEPDEAKKKKKKAKLEDASISDGSPAKKKPDVLKTKEEVYSNEEDNTAKQETTSEEVSTEFTAEEKEEIVTEEVVEFSMADVINQLAVLKAELAETKEKLVQFEQTKEVLVDEEEVLIQNSNAINSDEIISEEIKEKDEKAVKFSQKLQNNLFGLRG